MIKSREFFQGKREKRNELKEFLSEDLKLIYQDDIKPVKWNFKGELIKRRNSEEDTDKLFFQALKDYNENNKEIDQELIFEKEKNKEDLLFLLKTDQQLEEGLKNYVKKGKWGAYANLLSKMAELGKASDEQLNEALIKFAQDEMWGAYANLLSKMAELGKDLPENVDEQLEKGLEMYVQEGWWNDYIILLSKMAELGKELPSDVDEQLEEGLKQCAQEGQWYAYANLLSKMAELGKELPSDVDEQLEEGLKKYAQKGQWYAYANLLSKMVELGKASDEQLEEGLKQCAQNGWWPYYINLLSKMAELGKELPSDVDEQLEEGLKKYAQKGQWYDYTNFLSKMAELGKELPSDVDEQLEEGLKNYAKKGKWSAYTNLLSKMVELGKASDEQLEEGLKKYAKKGKWSAYTNLLSKMAELGKELPSDVDEQLKEVLKKYAQVEFWDDYTDLLSKMAELGKIDFNNQEYKNIDKWIESQEESEFVRLNLVSLYALNKDNIAKAQKENLASFQALRDLGIKVNDEIQNDDKKIEDVAKWFQNNTEFLTKLLSLGKLAESLIKEKINSSIPTAEGMIVSLRSAIDSDENLKLINQAIEQDNFSHPHDLEKFIEISSAFLKNNKSKELAELIVENPDKSLNERASEKLLNIIALELGIEADKITENDLEKWSVEYLPNLVSNKAIMDELIRQGDDGMENAQELYIELLKATFEGRVSDFLYNVDQESEVGQDVALHNQKTKEIFTKLDIDYAKWINYDKKQEFLVSTEVQVDNSKENLKVLKTRADEVLEKLEFFKDKISDREYTPLINILSGETNKKGIASAKKGELNNLFQKLEKSLHYLKTKEEYKEYGSQWMSVFEHLDHLKEAIDNVNKKEQKEIQSKEKGFQVKLWDRDPKIDLFQGNYSQCCIAVGQKEVPVEGGMTTHDPSTVMQFLSDTGMQVIEILDQDRKNPIGNTWLFVSKNNLGEPILILDNIELHSDYTNDYHLKKTIRDNLFSFVSQYAKECNFAGAYLGLVGTNDVSYDDLEKESVPSVEKIDSYLKGYTANNTRQGRYYLEAYNHNNLGKIYKQTEKQEIKIDNGFIVINNLDGKTSVIPYTQEVLENILNSSSDIITKDDIAQLEEVETSVFDKDSAEDLEEILEVMQNTKGLQFLFKEKDKVVGYLSSLPASDYKPHIEHSAYDNSSNILYVNSIAGKADPYSTLKILKEKAKEAGYSKLSMHGINPRLNKLLARAGFEPKEVIKEWLGDKSAAYMEMEL